MVSSDDEESTVAVNERAALSSFQPLTNFIGALISGCSQAIKVDRDELVPLVVKFRCGHQIPP